MANDSTRPFVPLRLPASSIRKIRARIGGGVVVWRYALLLPIEETRARQQPRQLATAADLAKLELMLATHFQGVTILSTVLGHGLREKRIEINRHIPYIVYAAPVAESEDYFQALKVELQDALGQETILIERHEVWVL